MSNKKSVSSNSITTKSETVESAKTETKKTESVTTEKAKSTEKPVLLGLERFMQLVPQNSGTTALLRSKFAMGVKTKEAWETVIKTLLNKQVR